MYTLNILKAGPEWLFAGMLGRMEIGCLIFVWRIKLSAPLCNPPEAQEALMAAHLCVRDVDSPIHGRNGTCQANVHDKNLNFVEQRYLREPLKILKRGCSLNPTQENKEGFQVGGVTER